MTLIPRKRCPKCSAVFEGNEVTVTYSCDVCGNGYLQNMEPKDTDAEASDHRLPRGGGRTITHTRESY